MTSPQRSYYRPEAVRRYLEGAALPVLRPLVLPRLAFALWTLLALLVLAIAWAGWVEIPVHVYGFATVVDWRDAQNPAQGLFVVGLLPANQLGRLRPQQSLQLHLDDTPSPLLRTVVAVEPHSYSPEEAQTRLGLPQIVLCRVSGPVAVVLAPLGSSAGEASAARYVGNFFRAQVEVERRPLLHLLATRGLDFSASHDPQGMR